MLVGIRGLWIRPEDYYTNMINDIGEWSKQNFAAGSPSLVTTPAKNLWHCLGACNAG